VGPAIALEDLVLLADCFYLPHEEGSSAEELFRVVETLVEQPVNGWGNSYADFQALNHRVQSLFERLTELRDRELFYAWSRRAWELKEELQVIDGVLAQKRLVPHGTAGGIALETHLPGTYRGGLVARLQRLLPMDKDGRFGKSNV
jgi:protein O-GlcNAcase/histone acetyltransferase